MTPSSPFDILVQTVHLLQPRGPTCAPLYPGLSGARQWAAAPPPRRSPLVPAGEGSGSRGPTGSFLPSLPPRLPPAVSGTTATSESASLCALCSGRAAPSSARATLCRTGSTGRGAAGLAPVATSGPEESDPCRSPRTCSLHPNISSLRCFFFSGEVCPASRFPPPWVPRCLQYFGIRRAPTLVSPGAH